MNRRFTLRVLCPECGSEVVILLDGSWYCKKCGKKGSEITPEMLGGEMNG